MADVIGTGVSLADGKALLNAKFEAVDDALATLAAADPSDTATASTPADVAQLLTDLGGSSAVQALYDVRAGVAAARGEVASWRDVRGATGYAPPLLGAVGSRPTWDATNQLVVAAGSAWLATMLDARFALTGAKTIVYVGTLELSASVTYLVSIASEAGAGGGFAARQLAVQRDNGFNSGALQAITYDATGGFQYAGSGVAFSTSSPPRRVAIATKGAGAASTTARVLSQASNAGGTSGTGGVVAAGDNALCLFSRGTATGVQSSYTGKGVARALLVLDHAITSGEVTALLAWAVAQHGAVAA